MNRPAPIPVTLKSLFSDPSIAYTTRTRLIASMTAWANRDGPITRGPSAAGLRDIVEIDPGSQRAAVAGYIDALQTALVASQELPNLANAGDRLVSMLKDAITTWGWHP